MEETTELNLRIEKLWDAAQAHCQIVVGDPLTDDDVVVTDPIRRLEIVTEYLEQTV